MKIRFLSLADREVADAVQWYEEQAEDLSRAFLDELDRVVRPCSYLPTHGNSDRTGNSGTGSD